MIRINVLPEELRPIKRTPLPHLLSVLVLLAAMAGMVLMFGAKAAEIAGVRAELVRAEGELDELRDVVEQYNALSKQKQQLEVKISVIQEILRDRLIWSEQLHRLAMLTPDNFWYRRIRETSKTVRMERVQVNEETGEPVLDSNGQEKIVRENVRRPVLEISGYVINDENGSNSIYPLTYATTQDDAFASIFTLDSPQITDSEFNGYAVRGFTLEYNIETGGEL